jgi:ribosomal peptide maturation radical SAM protein 1
MSFGEKHVCLVSMPFVPVNMPGLGVSTLKTTLASRGIRSDIYYGALEFLHFFSDTVPMRDLRLDYDFIATNMHVGELFFATTLWGDDNDVMDLVIERLATTPNSIFPREHMDRMAVRLRMYAKKVSALLDRCYQARDWSKYDIVGFSSTFSQNVSSLALARRIRDRHPDMCIVFGGANCETVMGEQLLRSFPQIDFVIRGEADFAFPQFVERWRRGEPVNDVPGIVYRDGEDVVAGAKPEPIANMDLLPEPDFDDYFEQQPSGSGADSLRANVILPIETSRGCWWGAVKHCIFCGLNPTTMKFRSKSGERALIEFRNLKARYRKRRFYAVDNILDRRYFHDLLPKLDDECVEIFYETKSNLSESEVRQLARAGVSAIQPGIEGLSSDVLALMQKGVKGYQNIELLKWCAMSGVDVTWFYLYGFPNEPEPPYLSDAANMDKLYHLPPPKNANPVLLDRFSPMFTRRDAYGLRDVRPSAAALIYYRGLSEQEIFNLCYHFDMDLPQGSHLSYAETLYKAVLRWRYEYLRGARFYQFEGRNSTLLLDTRSGGLNSYLLNGDGARIHRTLRSARHLQALCNETLSHQDTSLSLSVEDLTLAQVATYLGARVVTSPADPGGMPAFLDELVRFGIVLPIDGRFLALAVDCTQEEEAVPFGLGSYIVKRNADRSIADAPQGEPSHVPIYAHETVYSRSA